MTKKLWIALAALVLAAGIAFAILYCDHVWMDATCTAPETCEKCGKTQGEVLPHNYLDATCTAPETCKDCGATRGEILPHTWMDATCVAPQTCRDCDTTQGEALGHNWLDATCTESQTCTVCGETQGDPLDHSWLDATCTEPETCERCGETQSEKLGHKWKKATCTDPKTCKRCGKTKGSKLGHKWQDATCTEPMTCKRCDKTKGDPLGHDWLAANCARPESCSRCDATQGEKTNDHRWKNATCTSPKTCSVCGKTSGSALGHSWKAATCEKAKTCSTCGATSGSPLGHNFKENKDGKKVCSVCNQSVKIKYVAITFDDGPSGDITKRLLNGLKARGAKATFFICGYRIKYYKDLPQMILDGGHEIGLHTDNHATLTKLDAAGIRKELQNVLNMMPNGYRVTLMRPPGGAFNNTVKSVCKDMGLSVIMWNVDPRDWATSSASAVTSYIVSHASHGSIILLHDLKSSSVTGALNAIDILQDQGYVFVTVSELAEIMGKTIKPGEVYYSMK